MYFFIWPSFSLFSSQWWLCIFLFYGRQSRAVEWQRWFFFILSRDAFGNLPLWSLRPAGFAHPLLQKRVSLPALYWGPGNACERGCCSSTCLLKQFSRRPSSRIRFSIFIQVSQKLSDSEQLQGGVPSVPLQSLKLQLLLHYNVSLRCSLSTALL